MKTQIQIRINGEEQEQIDKAMEEGCELYCCIWEGPNYTPSLQIKKLTDFNEDDGYTQEDIKKIGELQQFGTYAPDQDHYIIKVY